MLSLRPLSGVLFALALPIFLTSAPATALAAATNPVVQVEQLVEEILQRNPELDFYRAEIAAAKAGQRTARQWSNPEFTAELGSKRVWERHGPALGDGVAWSVSVSQTFEWPGRLALRKAIANRQVELAQLGLSHFRNQLAARVRATARVAFAAQQRVDVLEEIGQRLESLLAVLVQREAAGVTPVLDQRILEAQRLGLEQRAHENRQERDLALIELNQWRGLPADTPLRLSANWQLVTNVPPLPQLMYWALSNSFELRLRQVELAQQGFQVELARHERYPTIKVGPYYSAESAQDTERIVGVAVSLPLPLWNKNEGAIEAARARQMQAEASLRMLQLELEKQVARHALALRQQLQYLNRYPPETMEAFRKAADLADEHYRLGAVPVTLYVEMQMKYLEAYEAMLTARQQAMEHQLQLEALLGRPLNGL
ncbi:TolC family protein [Fontisphaera persica]|jgi:cobalt-zinc-cadmium efflux system outer membrane protein|uniref:TolC family protein n=1 Tax=Fontisphaera persica TaxID=2974023 RepID=UPI0024C0C492|nr:TolC family protein [Fontisphaera persica]WCJ60172.1 TolC family protein [Fontisphaera persica]